MTPIYIAVGGRQKVSPHEVIMIEADLNYSIVYFTNGEKLMVATTLKKLEDRFMPFAFIRMNRQYVINKRFIVKDTGNGIVLSNDKAIMFSRRKGKAWREKLEEVQ